MVHTIDTAELNSMEIVGLALTPSEHLSHVIVNHHRPVIMLMLLLLLMMMMIVIMQAHNDFSSFICFEFSLTSRQLDCSHM